MKRLIIGAMASEVLLAGYGSRGSSGSASDTTAPAGAAFHDTSFGYGVDQ